MNNKETNNFVVSDTEIFELAINGDEEAFNELYIRYQLIGRQLTFNYFKDNSLEMQYIDEFLPELDFVFLETFRSFSPQKSAFKTYYRHILINHIRRYFGRVVLSNDILSKCVSMEKSDDNLALEGLLGDIGSLGPKEYQSFKDIELEIATPIKGEKTQKLNDKKKVVILRQIGYTFTEIAKMLHLRRQVVMQYFKDCRDEVLEHQEPKK